MTYIYQVVNQMRWLLYTVEPQYRMVGNICEKKKLCKFHENKVGFNIYKKKVVRIQNTCAIAHANSNSLIYSLLNFLAVHSFISIPSFFLKCLAALLAPFSATYLPIWALSSWECVVPSSDFPLLGHIPQQFFFTGSFYVLVDLLRFSSCQSISFICYWLKIAVYRHFDFDENHFLLTSW